ncbi:MAG: glycosyltransferase family 2 protein [Muribaculaceae bacterium]|nr:glycosyltransferase family 2 protein [Muribaculaceae bacterium]
MVSVSVCMATYNGERYLREQVESILSQLGEGDELVVSDDGSTDTTLDILSSFTDTRIKVFHNSGPHGVNGNFENALRHASGDYIFLSDQDDVWVAGKKERCLESLQRSDLVLHDALIVNKDLEPQNKTLFSELKIKEGFWANFIRNRFTGCCMAFKREILSYVLPFPKNVSFYHDSWTGLLVLMKGEVAILEDPLILFRRHGSNSSTAGFTSRRGLWKQLAERLSLGSNLIKRGVR